MTQDQQDYQEHYSPDGEKIEYMMEHQEELDVIGRPLYDKPKELEWTDGSGVIEFKTPEDAQRGIKWVNDALTQQRAELLEEIKKEVIGELEKPAYKSLEEADRDIARDELRLEQRQKLLNLLNKKDE